MTASDLVKVVLVGDGSVGKTCILSVYTTDKFPEKYVPTVVDNCTHAISVDNNSVRLCLWDTAGQEDYDRLRPLSYPGTDVFILCFSVDTRSSYQNVKDKWHPELRHFSPQVPLLLVGTKVDLRNDQDTIQHLSRQGASIVSPEEGEELARGIGAFKYVECSALQKRGLASVFEEATRAHLAAKGLGKKKQRKKPGKPCRLL